MDNDKKNLIVTLADANFINQAKQLFSSVYFNAGWEGDYLLLANDLSVEDLAWFKSKGIMIYECPLFPDSLAGVKNHPPVILSKLFIFKEYFKQWQKIIFLDADIIVRASLRDLLELNGFNAPNAATFRLKNEFINDVKENKLKQYNLQGKAFNTGIFVFDTDLITNHTFKDLQLLYDNIKDICLYGDESILNLFFYRKWHLLPITYNSIPWYMNKFYGLKIIVAHIIHFPSAKIKPWDERSDYYQEWSSNLSRAEDIDLTNRPSAIKIWSKKFLYFYLVYLKFRKIVYLKFRKIFIFIFKQFLFVNKQIGLFGLFIKSKNPKFYKLINLKKFLKTSLTEEKTNSNDKK